MDTDELKAQVEEFLKKLQQSIAKPAGSSPTPTPTPTPTEGKAPETIKASQASDLSQLNKMVKPAKTQPGKASDFVKGKPKPEFLEKAKQCAPKPVVTDAETGEPIEGVLCTIHGKKYSVPVEAEPNPEHTYILPAVDAATEEFYKMLLNLANLLVESVEKPPLSITFLLKGDKYELVEVPIVDKTIPEEAPEGIPFSLPIPLAYPGKIQVELSLGKDLVDGLLQLTEVLQQFIKQQDGGVME